MYQVEDYMPKMLQALQTRFGSRLLYLGLQGSYLRGEATQESDLDVVVILERLTAADLAAYKAIVESLPEPEKSCGFFCGRQELANWNPLEACNFLHGTRDYYGSLADFVPAYTKTDVANFIKLSVGNLYHALCHRYIHADAEKNNKKLPQSCKEVFFILQGLYYLKDGIFYPSRKALLENLCPRDRAVFELGERLRDGADYDFDAAFDLLLTWCQRVLAL